MEHSSIKVKKTVALIEKISIPRLKKLLVFQEGIL